MEPQISNARRRIALLVLSCILLAVGGCAVPLLTRLYFVHGGKRTWLSTWLTTAGWPVTLIPLIISYFSRRKSQGPNAELIFIKLSTTIASAILGIVFAPSNFFYAFGVAHLPVSTTNLIIATQLAFTAFFAFFIVGQKFTPHSINTIFLLTAGIAVLALHAGSTDKPQNESYRSYILGFVMIFATSILNGLFFPLMELVYKKANQGVDYILVLEVQLVISFFSTGVITIVMLINNDFKAIPREAREFQLGETMYYVVLWSTAILWQFIMVGSIGILFATSALVTGIMTAFLLPISEILAVLFYHEKFEGEKGLSLALSLWGFISYLYGEWKLSKQKRLTQETEIRTS